MPRDHSLDALEVLLELTRALARATTLESALKSTTDAALQLLPGDHTSLRLFDDERTRLVSTARSGVGSDKKPALFMSGSGVLGHVARSGESVLIRDTSKDARFIEATTGFDLRSMLAVPMNAGGRVIGVLSCSSPELGCFANRDLDLAQLLANCAVAAIETARLGRLAITDELTGAYNVRYYRSRIEEELRRARRYEAPLSLLLLDLDHFKSVNDRFGHAAGDEALRGFCQRVSDVVRDSDLLIRRGGEEFVLLMPESDPDAARAVAERIRERVGGEAMKLSGGKSLTVTVSIGVASLGSDDSADALEARADAACYQAKQMGRDRVVSAPAGAKRSN